jgi:hypothetical protein
VCNYTILSEAYEGDAIKMLSTCKGHNRPKKSRMSKSQMMTMLITFLDFRGIVHFEFIRQGQIVNQAYYMEILKRLREAVHSKRPQFWLNDWIIHHDNAPAHKVLSSSFWPKNRLLDWNTQTVLLVRLRMTFGCFQK